MPHRLRRVKKLKIARNEGNCNGAERNPSRYWSRLACESHRLVPGSPQSPEEAQDLRRSFLARSLPASCRECMYSLRAGSITNLTRPQWLCPAIRFFGVRPFWKRGEVAARRRADALSVEAFEENAMEITTEANDLGVIYRADLA